MSDFPPFESYAPRFDEVAVAAEAAATKVRTSGKVEFSKGDLVYVSAADPRRRSGEILLVLKATKKTITVRRGVGSQPQPLEKGDELVLIGMTEPETSDTSKGTGLEK